MAQEDMAGMRGRDEAPVSELRTIAMATFVRAHWGLTITSNTSTSARSARSARSAGARGDHTLLMTLRDSEAMARASGL